MPNSHTQTVNPSAHLQYGSAHAREITASDIAVGVVVGRTVSFFDLFVFGIACVMVFPEVFFPFVNQTDGMFYSFAIFALGFLAQPFGSVFFMLVQRHFGRTTKLNIALRSAERRVGKGGGSAFRCGWWRLNKKKKKKR